MKPTPRKMNAQLFALLLISSSVLTHAQCVVTYSDMAKMVKMNKSNFEIEANNLGFKYDPFNNVGRRVYKCAGATNQMDRVGGDMNLKTIDYATYSIEEMQAFREALHKAGFQEMGGELFGWKVYFHTKYEARISQTITSDKKTLYHLQLSEI